jgi:addiction module HigA family antidote
MIPKNRPTHPGKFVKKDILKELGLTQTQLANALGVPRHTITQLVNEKCDLTADMALRLSRFTQTTPEMWLNLQLNFGMLIIHLIGKRYNWATQSLMIFDKT